METTEDKLITQEYSRGQLKKKETTTAVSKIIKRVINKTEILRSNAIDDDDIYKLHSILITKIGNFILSKEGKEFKVDENNKDILKFLLYYFNGSEKAVAVFPNEAYSLDKQIMLIGDVGAGKTLIMQIFSEYTERMKLDTSFKNVSTSQMMNYYKINNHLNQYTFNEQPNSFDGKPINLCLNDLGLSTYKHYGTDLKELVKDFLFARNDLYVIDRKMAHITTNLTPAELKEEYNDEFNRLSDRFKTYNVLYLRGESKR